MYALVISVIIWSDAGLSPFRRQANTWTNYDILTFRNKKHVFIQQNVFQNVVSKMATFFFRSECVKCIYESVTRPRRYSAYLWIYCLHSYLFHHVQYVNVTQYVFRDKCITDSLNGTLSAQKRHKMWTEYDFIFIMNITMLQNVASLHAVQLCYSVGSSLCNVVNGTRKAVNCNVVQRCGGSCTTLPNVIQRCHTVAKRYPTLCNVVTKLCVVVSKLCNVSSCTTLPLSNVVTTLPNVIQRCATL